MTDKILLTMDDLETAVRANAACEQSGFHTVMVSSLDDARGVVRREEPDVAVLTGALHERPAQDLIKLARDRSLSTLGLLEATETDPATQAAKLGLTAWLVKPSDPAEVVASVRRLIDRRRLQERTGIIGESAAIQEVLVKIEQLAPVSSTVLIEGESGTGKELVAQAVHALSPRRAEPFVAVNCAALPETLLESELFGHEKGAFTGAAERRLGRFELADGGTIFLDEVGEMPGSTQVKLLRVLENQSFFRVGGAQAIRVNVRVIAATNRALKEEVAMGRFRDDLYYRLNVLSIYLPPLRERKSDIPILVRRFVKDLSQQHNRTFHGIAPEAMQLLVNAHWPGNIRQLRNLIESMVVLAPGRQIRSSDIPNDVRDQGSRLLPARMPLAQRDSMGSELEFILRSLVELKLQLEDLRRQINQPVARPVEVIDMGRIAVGEVEKAGEAEEDVKVDDGSVLFREGMTMAQVEKAAIEATLKETKGNRRKTASKLGIGERTLYRKIKEYGLD